jgi:hypothetical protein
MPFNLLLFPIVGGFFIITRLERFKYINQRLDRQMILFNSILVGMALLVTAYIVCTLCTMMIPDHVYFLKHHSPIKQEYFGTSLVSFLLAFPITWIANAIIKEEEAIGSAIDRIGSELEKLFKYSCDAREPLQMTLKNGKVYVGWVQFLPKPQASPYVTIIPVLSGYRDEKQHLHITTTYIEIYAQYMREGLIQGVEDLDVFLVIQVDEILTATRFDFEMFEKFEKALIIKKSPPNQSGT